MRERERDVCVRERERERDVCVCECVCECECVSVSVCVSVCVLTCGYLHSAQAASLLCVQPACRRRPRAAEISTDCFGAARRSLSHLKARMEELWREEVDKITRAGAFWVNGGQPAGLAPPNALNRHRICVLQGGIGPSLV